MVFFNFFSSVTNPLLNCTEVVFVDLREPPVPEQEQGRISDRNPIEAVFENHRRDQGCAHADGVRVQACEVFDAEVGPLCRVAQGLLDILL